MTNYAVRHFLEQSLETFQMKPIRPSILHKMQTPAASYFLRELNECMLSSGADNIL
jgi:hypothetical protein